jgi:polyferredoxin
MNEKTPDRIVARRRVIQWILAPIVIIVIALGWRYPYLGFSVPIVMLMGFIGGIFNGRYVCGNLCPRGGFLDRMLAPLARKVKTPPWMFNMPFRVILLISLMALMIWRILLNPTSIEHWGRVFWLMCTVTTAVALVLAFFYNARSWCAICPMGTMQNLLGRRHKTLLIDPAKCIECRLCERKCPLSLQIVRHKSEGIVDEPDCIKCSECIAVCPKQALSWQIRNTAE